MNFELFIARRITLKAKRTFSRLIVNIALTGITLGLAVMIIAVAIVTGFKAEIRDKIVGFSGHIKVTRYDLNNSLQNTAIRKDRQFYALLDSTRWISHIQAFANKVGIIKTRDQIEPTVLKGVDRDFNWNYLNERLISGRVIHFTDTAPSKECLISNYTAKRLNLKPGDDFLVYFAEQQIRVRKFVVSGIYDIGIEDLDKLYMICDIAVVQRLNNWMPEEVGGFEIFIKKYEHLDAATDFVYNSVGNDMAAYSIVELYPQIFDWLSLLDVNTEVILVLMLLVAGINMISALLIMILERTNMIGILKALGATNVSVRGIFMYNAAYIIGVGMLLGNVIGLGFCFLQDKFHFVKLDQQSYYVSYAPVELSATPVVLLNIGTLVVCFLMLIGPSFLVTRITPVKAMRFK